MQVWTWIKRQLSGTAVQELAEDLAVRCLEPVWSRVYGRVVGMSLAEVRGYVRARAALVLACELERMRAEYPGQPVRQWERVHEGAAEFLVDRMERRVFEYQRQAPSRRRAA